ncbi:MAG: type I restriction enzyme HsdR N-terminal domain-containing protein [Bacteroidetes bacterium]|nr:type I restriction enzyme HsdR N-terminal domain-containing protein [Bacteroidota bacterium]
MTLKQKLFGKLNFSKLSSNPDFKEDSVREVIILPILKELGYEQKNIVRSKTLQHPFLKIGSNKRIPIKLMPDYVLKVDKTFAWVLDAKGVDEKVIDDEHIAQVYSYAVHPEINSIYFAICNGLEFALYRKDSYNVPVLFFRIEEIDENWATIKRFLSINSFQAGKSFVYEPVVPFKAKEEFNYATRPLLDEIPVKKQQAKRHFGVHGYFTKQTWNVVAEYIKNFSQAGDLVLDPFGGSGVTPIEAMMNNRKTISVDLNPMAVFIVKALMAPVKHEELAEAFERVATEYKKREPNSKEEIERALEKYPYPKGYILPKGSDVVTVEQLFSKKQLAQLALLKSIIKREKEKYIRESLLIAFSSSVNKFNLTFHYTRSEGGGDSGPFRYYRYRMAPKPGQLDLMSIFKTKMKKVLDAKKDIAYYINERTISNAQIVKDTATNLSWIPKESVDYIYTDPPYGKKIPYLDLSVMWNAWLDLEVTRKDRLLEAIEGGEENKSKEEYNRLIAESIKEMYRVLKYDRWLSFVFAHKDPEFWHLIINTAENCGFEYVGAVAQKNGQTSFKKRQHPFTVLSGQLIINFRKVRNPRAIMKANLGMDIAEIVMQTIEGIIAKHHGATLEQINDELIIKGLELGFLDLLKKEYSDLTPILFEHFDYDDKTEIFTIRKNAKFKTHIDVRLRIKFYLISFLRRMENENKSAHFDEIIQHIIPLLKNGITPENQTILKVLEDIGEQVGKDSWRLKKNGELNLFGY